MTSYGMRSLKVWRNMICITNYHITPFNKLDINTCIHYMNDGLHYCLNTAYIYFNNVKYRSIPQTHTS